MPVPAGMASGGRGGHCQAWPLPHTSPAPPAAKPWLPGPLLAAVAKEGTFPIGLPHALCSASGLAFRGGVKDATG